MRKDTCKMSELWILKFVNDGSVWAAETPPSLSSHISLPGRHGGNAPSRAAASGPLRVGDFVLSGGKRAQIKNIFLSVTHGSLACLFFIDTAEDGTVPVHELSPLPEDLLYPPLAQNFTLDGISPHVATLSHSSRQQMTSCVGRSDSTHHGRWGLLAMNTLRSVAGGDGGEVKVHADVKPGDSIVIYCDDEGSKLNFNQFLIDAGVAVPPPTKATPPPSLPNSDQLLAALESLREFQTEDSRPVSKLADQTSSGPPVLVAELPTPYQYHTVYIESPVKTKPLSSLEHTNFPISVCKLLTRLGFQTPSPIQGCSWPLVGRGGLAMLVSPPLSGKTLAYLLPLVTKRELGGSSDGIPHPRLVVVVPSSWGARAVYTRAVQLISAMSAHRRFRCCCAYKALEGQAIVELLNGVEVLVCTPTSLLRLIDKTVANLKELTHLVLDNFERLQEKFALELQKIFSLCSRSMQTVSVVVTTSQWSQELQIFPAQISSHAHLSCSPAHLIIACPIEATMKAGVKMDVIPCLLDSPDSILQTLLSRKGRDYVIACVATMETANRVSQQLKSLCWPVTVCVDGEGFEKLLQKDIVIILVDDVLPSLLPCGAAISHLIHYELPKNKTAFTNRLALLYTAIHRGVSCCHTILLTSAWCGQAGLVKKIMERMNQSPPRPLLDMAEKAMEASEEQRRNFDLCYKLKAWGSCSDPLCPSRHTHNTSPSSFLSPQPLQLPQDGSVKLKVSHVSTATRWWVSLLGHAPLYRGAEPVKPYDPDGLVNVTSDLAQYFTPERQQELLHSAPPEGNYCALKDRDGCFYRVRILKFSRPLEFLFHHREKAKVRLIDVGEARIVDVSQLLALPDHLLTRPPLVFEVFLCGVRPTDFDPDWPPQAAEAMRQVYGDKEVHGRVVLVIGETVWLDPVERRFLLTGLNISTALTSPQQQLMKAGMAEPNPDHLVNLSSHLGLPLIRVEHISIDDARLSFASFSSKGDDCVEVCVSAVDLPNQFYLQQIATETRVIEVEDAINRDDGVGTMAGCHSDPLPVGTVCAAQFSYNKSWYRGCVLEVRGQESQVRFLDYGNVEWVPNHLVQPIHPSALELPFQALPCTFGMDDTKWGEDANTLLYEWTRDAILIAKVRGVTASPSEQLQGAQCFIVELFEQTSRGGEGRNVAMRLPADRPAPISVPSSQSVSSPLDQLCLSLCDDLTATEERESITMAIKNTVYNKPGVCISGCVLASMCQFLTRGTPPSVSIPLLQALCCLATFHSSIHSELSNRIASVLLLVKDTSEDVIKHSLKLIVILLKHASSASVLCTEATVELLLGVFHLHGNGLEHRRGNTSVVHLLIPILHHITTARPALLPVATAHGIIPLLCDWLTHVSSPLSPPPPPPHTLVILVVGMLVGVAKIPHCQQEVSQGLPLNQLHTLLLKESTTSRMVHAILGLLILLSSLPEFRARLQSSSLFTCLCKLPMTSPSGLLLQLLRIRTEPANHSPHNLTNQISPRVSDSYDDYPPPLVDDGGNPLVVCNNETSTNGSGANQHQPQQNTPTLRPRVLWSQREETVLLAVQLRGCEERHTETDFSPTNVSFRTRVWNRDYLFSIDLYATIDPDACSLALTGSEALLKLVKMTPANWPRLHQGEGRLSHVTVDFDRWQDSEFGSMNGAKWPAAPTSKPSNTYVNPLLTDSDREGTDSGSGRNSPEEEEEERWEDEPGFDD